MFDLLITVLVVVFLYKVCRLRMIAPIYNAVLLLLLLPVMIIASLIGINIEINDDNLPTTRQ